MRATTRSPAYNEPSAIARSAIAQGAPARQVAADYGGGATWDSCWRARRCVRRAARVVVTNDFHRARSIVLCEAAGITVDAARRHRHQPLCPLSQVGRAQRRSPPGAGAFDCMGAPPRSSASAVGAIDPYDPCALQRFAQRRGPPASVGCAIDDHPAVPDRRPHADLGFGVVISRAVRPLGGVVLLSPGARGALWCGLQLEGAAGPPHRAGLIGLFPSPIRPLAPPRRRDRRRGPRCSPSRGHGTRRMGRRRSGATRTLISATPPSSSAASAARRATDRGGGAHHALQAQRLVDAQRAQRREVGRTRWRGRGPEREDQRREAAAEHAAHAGVDRQGNAASTPAATRIRPRLRGLQQAERPPSGRGALDLRPHAAMFAAPRCRRRCRRSRAVGRGRSTRRRSRRGSAPPAASSSTDPSGRRTCA